MKWLAGYIAAVCVLLVIVSQAVFIPSFFMPFFRWQFEVHDVVDTIGMEDKESLMSVTTELLDYMRGRRDSIADIYAEINGEHQRFFSERDIIHMVDVLDLYAAGFMIRNVAVFMLIFIILAMYFFGVGAKDGPAGPGPFEIIARCLREVIAGFVLLCVILTIVIAWDFTTAFYWFHILLFDNLYWQLTPGVDRLIDMVPQRFFINISIFIGLLILLFSAAAVALCTLYLRAAKNRISVWR